MKRIIVEGVDGTGKTSLIGMINQRMPDEIVVINGFKHNPYGFTDYTSWMNYEFSLVHDAGRRTPVHDRFFYSEVVYGEVLRGGITIDPYWYNKVLAELRKDALLIYCRPPLSIVKTTSTANPQMEGVAEKLPQLYDSYEELMQGEAEIYKDRFVVWDMTRHFWINYLNPVIRRYLAS